MLTDFPNEIIGQDALLDLVDSYSNDAFPQSVLLIGERGCGKHTLCNYIAWSHQWEIQVLDNKITDETIESIFLSTRPCLYQIDLDNALPKLQNTLLKLIEEPPVGAYIVGLAESISTVLPTIQNRCQKWQFKGYTTQQLQTFIQPEHFKDKDFLLSLFTTPGQILVGQQQDLSEVISLSDKMIDRIGNATFANVLSISDKVAFKQEDAKIDLLTLVRALRYRIVDKIKQRDDNKYYQMFNIIAQIEHKLNFSISKQRTFEEFLITLKEIAKQYG